MRAGKRDRLVTFQRGTGTTGADGHDEFMWATLCTEYAEVIFGTGQERRAASQEAGEAPATFRVLWNEDTASLKLTDRISYSGVIWDISSVVPLGLNEGVEVTARRRAA